MMPPRLNARSPHDVQRNRRLCTCRAASRRSAPPPRLERRCAAAKAGHVGRFRRLPRHAARRHALLDADRRRRVQLLRVSRAGGAAAAETQRSCGVGGDFIDDDDDDDDDDTAIDCRRIACTVGVFVVIFVAGFGDADDRNWRRVVIIVVCGCGATSCVARGRQRDRSRVARVRRAAARRRSSDLIARAPSAHVALCRA